MSKKTGADKQCKSQQQATDIQLFFNFDLTLNSLQSDVNISYHS